MSLIGYAPKIKETSKLQYYYFPFYMNGKVFVSSLFDSMISWTFDEYNHLETLKKLVNNNYFRSQVQQDYQEYV